MKNISSESDKGHRTLLYLEAGTILVNSRHLAKRVDVSGTKTNNENAKLQVFIRPVVRRQQEIESKKSRIKQDSASLAAYQRKEDAENARMEAQLHNNYRKFISENPGSLMSVNALSALSYSTDRRIYSNCSITYHLPCRSAAPEIAEQDTIGALVKLSSFRGSYVLVDFWASWCVPCRAENPNTLKLYQQFKGKGFTVLGVSLDSPDQKDKWMKAIEKDGLTWPQVADLHAKSNEAAQLYNIRAIPSDFLVGPDGIILAKNIFGEELKNKLLSLLKD